MEVIVEHHLQMVRFQTEEGGGVLKKGAGKHENGKTRTGTEEHCESVSLYDLS